ncbi:23919_t:CDS:2 [Cetraspora pellucida]|uniref:23919_t:CDS:1 n=1 Tax=Cetraspora pellucida TaxID=1433469 RepID=A0A9N9G842_9GLOM|nr:23919_t:CDS:2 [Cetraspora pellucida]
MLSSIHNYFVVKSYQSDINTSPSLEPWERALLYFASANYPESNIHYPLKICEYHSLYL